MRDLIAVVIVTLCILFLKIYNHVSLQKLMKLTLKKHVHGFNSYEGHLKQEDNHFSFHSISRSTINKERTIINRQLYEENLEFRAFSEEPINCEGIKVNVEVVSDVSLFHVDGWEIIHLATKKVVWSSSFFDKPLKLYNESTCLNVGEYRFSFHDFNNNGLISEDAYYILRVNEEIVKETHGPLAFRLQTTYFGYCSSDTDCFDDNVCTNEYCESSTKTCMYEFQKHYSTECPAFGNQSALAIRVISLDAETTGSANDIGRSIFGTSEGEFSLSSQLSSCSYNRLNIQPFTGITNAGTLIEGGVLNLFLPTNTIGEAANVIGSLALTYAYESIENLTNNVLIFICLPPKTKIGISENWKAYAFVNAFHSIYNDINCLYPSVLMHEVGHNLGLSHSNDDKNYGDESGAMGISYTKTDGPMKCYNAPKSWQLGWYADSHLIIDASNLARTIRTQLVGISDYDKRQKRDTIIKIINSNDGYDYYINFNRKTGMNIETNEGGDKVIVSKRPTGLLYEDSTLLQTISVSRFSYTLVGFDGSEKLEIVAKYVVDEDLVAPYVGIFKWTSYCQSDSVCDDFNACTTDLCISLVPAYGMCEHSPVKDCKICGNKVIVSVTTNENPESVSWKISNTVEELALMSSGSYTDSFKSYMENACVPFGRYKFSIANSRNSTHESSHFFSLEVGSIILDQGELRGVNILETNFIICSSDKDCHDYDGCTIDNCDVETTLCKNVVVGNKTACNECSWLSVNITMDNFPEETGWNIVMEDSQSTLLSGDPYALYLRRNGRRKAPTKAGRSKAPTRASVTFSMLNDNDDAIQIFERFCAENNVKFRFTITDSFGDGICCDEGIGGYELMGNNEIMISGGDFGDIDNLIFMFSNCFSDSDCEDDDSCTIDSCSASNSICFYKHLSCDECGAIVSIKFYTDLFPTETTWTLKKGEKELISEGPYPLKIGEYHHSICLSHGSYALKINDSDGITWCCDYTRSTPDELEECIKTLPCGYEVLLYNQTILEGGDNVPFLHKDIYFGLCEEDSDCEDFDICTTNRCDLGLKICKFDMLPCMECAEDPCDHSSSCLNPLPCSSCGKTLFSADIYTDLYSIYLRWNLRHQENKNILASGLWYGKSYHHYNHEMCLENGIYEFSVLDLGLGYGSGVVYCNDTNIQCGNWSVSLDGSILKEGNRNFKGVDLTIFEAMQPTNSPTFNSNSPSNKSIKPTTFPPSIKSSSKLPSPGIKAPRKKKTSKRSKNTNKKRPKKNKTWKKEKNNKTNNEKKVIKKREKREKNRNKKESSKKQSRKKENNIIPFDTLS